MFPEYRELISKLKVEHSRFQSIFEKHNALDHEIIRLEKLESNAYSVEIANLKKEKLLLKDMLHVILREASEVS